MNDFRPETHPGSLRLPPADGVSLPMRLRTFCRQRWGVLVFVALPTALASLYYFVIAAGLYASSASFVVRSPGQPQAAGLVGLLQGSGAAHSPDDVYAVQDYILSRDAVTALAAQLDLRAVFARPEADFIARYPDPLYHGSDEDFYRYYLHRVTAVYDSDTGITTLTVKAFRAEDAQRIASLLVQSAETLVNRLNTRAHDNAVKDAEADVQRAEDAVTAAGNQMLDWRQHEALLDPDKSSGALFETASALQAQIAATRVRLAELDRSSPNSPLRAGLVSHMSALQAQMDDLNGRMAGGDAAMAPKIAEYQRLNLNQDFATKGLESALASLETARTEARRQQVYLERVVEANAPDKAMYPQRLISVLIVFISCVLVYGIAALLLAGVREHRQE